MRTILLLACAALSPCACTTAPDARAPRPVRAPVAAALPADLTPAARQAVLDLESEDFAVRNRASETLLAMGEDALPVLTAAGDRRTTAHGKVSVSVTRPVLEAVLEGSSDEALEKKHLASPSAFLRRAAARELGRRLDADAVPALTLRLSDDDALVRAAAAEALRRIAEPNAEPKAR